jgi:hypothetical protein
MGPYTARDVTKKYDPQPSAALGKYTLVQWVVVLLGVFFFLLYGAQLSLPSKVASVVFILMSLVSLPSLVEGRTWAKALEGARLVALPVLAVVLFVAR